MKTTISIACPNMLGGGAERVMDTLATHLKENGDLGKVYSNLVPKEAIYKSNIVSLGGRVSALNAALPIIQNLQYDTSEAILLTLGFVNIAPLIKLLYPKKRILIRIGNSIKPEFDILPPSKRFFRFILLKVVCLSANKIIVQSRSMFNEIIEYTSVNAEKIITIYNPINTKSKILL